MSNDKKLIECCPNVQYCQTRISERNGGLIWKISSFSTQLYSEYLRSPEFRIPGDDTVWYIRIYPKRNRDNEEYISVYLYASNSEEISVTCEFSLVDVSGEKQMKRTFSRKMDSNMGYFTFCTRGKVLDHKLELLPDDELTLSCVLTKRVETVCKCRIKTREGTSVGDHRNSSLCDDMAKHFDLDLMRSADVVLKVGNEQISAHKMMLTCRSPVFASMFEHDMIERDTSEVLIADVEIEVLKELVRFIYTDAFSDYGVSFTLKLLVAADKYDLPSLKARCAEYLGDRVSESDVIQILKVADACDEKELVSSCMSVIECEMSSVKSLKDWISKLNGHPEMLGVIEKLLSQQGSDCECD